MEQLQKDKESLQAAQANLEAETREMVKVSNRLHDNFTKAMKLMSRQVLFIWVMVILLCIAFFLIFSKFSSGAQVAPLSSEANELAGQTAASPVSSPAPPTPLAAAPMIIPSKKERPLKMPGCPQPAGTEGL